MPALEPGESAEVKLPLLDISEGGEACWTLRAVLARDTAWAPAGHVVAKGQVPAAARRMPAPAAGAAVAMDRDATLVLGPGVFDARTGELRTVGAVPV